MEVDKDNKDRMLVKKEWLRRAEKILIEEDDLKKKIRKAQERNK